jgi:hypothetical protein
MTNPFLNSAAIFIMAFVLALGCEGGVEAIFGIPFNFIPKIANFKKPILSYIGLAAGIGVCLFYKIDMIYAVSQVLGVQVSVTDAMTPTVLGYLLTGTIVGRGSNAVHDFIANILGPKSPLPLPATAAADTAERG